MKFIETKIKGIYILEPRIFEDERGYFFESFNQREFEKHVGPVHFVQDNESKSTYGVVRGLHFQKGDFAQAKLLRVIQGSVLDVAVDLRKNSPTFGEYIATELTAEKHNQLFIPRGFAHGFSVLSKEVIFQYKCDNFYEPKSEGGIAWNDPALNIDWKIPQAEIILSPKDKQHKKLSEIEDDFLL